MRTCRLALLLVAVLQIFTVACGREGETTGGTTTATGGSAGAGGTGGEGGTGGGGGVPGIDPGLFDCTAAKVPERVNPNAVECATDVGCKTKLVTGHRGVGGELGVIAPEDTLAAVRAAIVLGIDFVETDPRPTKDGVLVNMHDPEVDRTTDGTGLVEEMTLAEVQALHLNSDEFAGDFSCERVPTLEEVLLAARGKVHVLVDANKTDQVALLVDAIQKTDTVDWAIFDTSSLDKIDAALALEPALHTQIRVSTEAELSAALEHFAAHPPIIVEISGGGDPATMVPAIHAAGNRAFIDVFVTDVGAGFSGDPALYQDTWDLGLDIVQTDRPDLVLQSIGRWPPPPQP